MLIAALYTGVAMAARDWTADFLRNRAPTSLGASLATLPRMQEAMGKIEALLATNRRLAMSAARDYEAGHPPSVVECNLIKVTAAENAIAAVQDCVALTSNHGLSRANPLERHLRDVLCARIHTPQADAGHIAAGRALLGT
jgi:alkylation response protein AidB-like acyl-CoA dehydrogenase